MKRKSIVLCGLTLYFKFNPDDSFNDIQEVKEYLLDEFKFPCIGYLDQIGARNISVDIDLEVIHAENQS